MSRNVPLKRVAKLMSGQSPKSDDVSTFDGQFPFLQGNAEFGSVNPNPRFSCMVAPKRCQKGDLLVSVRAPVGALNIADREYGIGRGLSAVRPIAINPKYLWWCLHGLIEQLRSRSVGSTYDAVTVDDVGIIPIWTPNERVQSNIARFLDFETARIDALIEKKRRLVELAHLRYRAEVDELTAHGPAVPVRRVAESITSGPRGWSDQVGEVGLPFIRSANLRRDEILLRSDNVMRVDVPPTAEATRSRVQQGDTLVGITGANTGWVGLVDASHVGGFISQHVARIRPQGVAPAWLAYSVFAQRSQELLLGGQYGGAKQQLGLEDLAELTIRVPSMEEQRELVQNLQRAARLKADLVEKFDRQIGLLKEHRQALITAVVTGETELPEASR